MKEFLQHLRKVRLLRVCALQDPCLIERRAECACIALPECALSLWLQHVTVGIVGGSDFHKICEQLGSDGAHLSPVTLLREMWKSLRPAQLSMCREGWAGPQYLPNNLCVTTCLHSYPPLLHELLMNCAWTAGPARLLAWLTLPLPACSGDCV